MQRRAGFLRLTSGLAAAVLTVGLAAGPPSALRPAAAAEGGVRPAPVALWAPTRQVVQSYNGTVFSDLGLRLVADGGAFEVWSTRQSYDEPVRAVWRSPDGDVPLPDARQLGPMSRFLTLTISPLGGGTDTSTTRSVCLAGRSERVRPTASATSPYPRSCHYNAYGLGAVQGIQDGWATALLGYDRPLRLEPGHYDVTARIRPAYATALQLSSEAASRTFRVVVEPGDGDLVGRGRPHRESESSETAPAPTGARVGPAGMEPRAAAGGEVAGPTPDLRSLPAFGINVARNGNYLQFSATVWNAGDSPLVVDGFRREDEDEMDAYQYFFDTNGDQTGYQRVGRFEWDAEPTHRHWHFEDFATYRLLTADRSESVRSRKEAFCLANTDAVDLTVPGASWNTENDDLTTACGDSSSVSLREVLAAGWGDTYAQFRAGQSFNLKGLPNGTYWIAVVANPAGNLVESDVTNNVALREVRIGGRPGARTVRVPRVGLVEEPDLFQEVRPGR